MPRITALPTEIVRALQAGGPDAHGQRPERGVGWRRQSLPPLPEVHSRRR